MNKLSGRKLLDELGTDYFYKGSSFGALSKDSLIFLMTEGEILELNKNDLIFDLGEKSDSFYIVISGRVAFYKLFENKLLLMREYGFGEEIGYVAMIGLRERIGKGKALENSIVLKVSSDLFGLMHELHPTDFGIFLLNLSREMARTIMLLSNTLAENKINHPGKP